MNKFTPLAPDVPDISEYGTDWDYLRTMTDEEIAQTVELDPAAAPMLSAEELRKRYKPHPPRIKR